MYHPHERPLSTLPAVMLDISSSLANYPPFSFLPRPSSSHLASQAQSTRKPSAFASLNQSLSIPPIHVDQVAECVLRSIEHPEVKGVVDTRDMRRWMGLDEGLGEGGDVVLPLKNDASQQDIGQRGGHGKNPSPFAAPTGQTRSISTGANMTMSNIRPNLTAPVFGFRRSVTFAALGSNGSPQTLKNNQTQDFILEPAPSSADSVSPGVSTSKSGGGGGGGDSASKSTENKNDSSRSTDAVIESAANVAGVSAATRAASSNSKKSKQKTVEPKKSETSSKADGEKEGTITKLDKPPIYEQVSSFALPLEPKDSAFKDMPNPMATLPLPNIHHVGSAPRASSTDKSSQSQGADNGQAAPGSADQGNDDMHNGSLDNNAGALEVAPSLAGAAAVTPQFQSPYDHPFDTHAFVTRLEKAGFSSKVAESLMRATRQMLVERSGRAKTDLLHKEDTENAAYLFRAALSELRTELNVRARNDGLALRSATNTLRREVDSLNQRMKEEIGGLKHDIEMDMNNRKGETRSDQKAYELFIEEINGKFTISLGDLKTEIEQAKWDATRRAISEFLLARKSIASVLTTNFPHSHHSHSCCSSIHSH